MSTKRLPIVMTYLLVWTLLFSTLAFGQAAEKRVSADSAPASEAGMSYERFLTEVEGTPASGQSYTREVQTIARVLSSSTKNPVLIDDQGYARETVLQAVATRLASGTSGKRLYRVNWNAVFGATRDEKELNIIVDGSPGSDTEGRNLIRIQVRSNSG